eukprot:1161163-Pelagomonas_calceolata.AAC.4
MDAALASQLSELVQAGQVKTGSTIKVCGALSFMSGLSNSTVHVHVLGPAPRLDSPAVKAYTVAHKDEANVLLSVTDVEVLSSGAGVVPLGDATASINLHTPATKSSGAARKLETPPEPSPSEE